MTTMRPLLLLSVLAAALVGCGADEETVGSNAGAVSVEAVESPVEPGVYDSPNGTVLVKSNAESQAFIVDAGTGAQCTGTVSSDALKGSSFKLEASKKTPCDLKVGVKKGGFSLAGTIDGKDYAATYTRRSENALARDFTDGTNHVTIAKSDDNGITFGGVVRGSQFTDVVARLTPQDIETTYALRYQAQVEDCYFWLETKHDEKGGMFLSVDVIGPKCAARGNYPSLR